MARITTLHVLARITRQTRRLAHALAHAVLIASVDLVVAGLGLPLWLHLIVGAVVFLGIETILRRR
jgi:hypothetical protein